MSDYVRVCSVGDVEDDGIIRVMVGGRAVALAKSEGELFALLDWCSHAEIPLSEGEVMEGRVECWLHGSQFDLRSGRPCQLPATRPVPTFPVKIDGDDVLVAVQES